jgi:hypothetical protein
MPFKDEIYTIAFFYIVGHIYPKLHLSLSGILHYLPGRVFFSNRLRIAQAVR